MTKVGVITIGQAPREDIAETFGRHLSGAGIDIEQRGALDGYTKEEVENFFAPHEGSITYVSKLLDGTSVTLAKDRLLPKLQQHIDELTETCDAICVVCTGDFPTLTSSRPMFFPDRILVDELVERDVEGKLGLMIPLAGQEDGMAAKWERTGLPIVFEAASPYDASDIPGAARRLQAAGATEIVLDCIGYTREQGERVHQATGIQAIVPQELVPEAVLKRLNPYASVVRNVLANNVTLEPADRVLVLTDDSTKPVAENFLSGLRANGVDAELFSFPDRAKSGEEPPEDALAEVLSHDATFCLTLHSLTHTAARKAAVAAGKLFITMPGVTDELLTTGAMTADYGRVEKETLVMAEKISEAEAAVIHSGEGHTLVIPLHGREGIPSTGVYRGKGTGGNLPSGEAYVAPVEYQVSGTLEVNGSIAGIGKLSEPVVLEIAHGRLETASGPVGAQLLELLGDGLGRQVAEFGIGTNHAARIVGNILEDEKAYNTIHVAFGSNNTFGGTIAAGVHIDCIVDHPTIEWK